MKVTATATDAFALITHGRCMRQKDGSGTGAVETALPKMAAALDIWGWDLRWFYGEFYKDFMVILWELNGGLMLILWELNRSFMGFCILFWFIVFHGSLMVILWNLMGFYAHFMGFNGDLMVILWNLMGFHGYFLTSNGI